METSLIIPEFWGYCFRDEHNPQAFADAFGEIRSSLNPAQMRYLEIGLGNCGTVNAVDFLLRQLFSNYSINACEIPEWHHRYLVPASCSCIFFGGRLTIPRDAEYHFIFIDGCHCRRCVVEDFRHVEAMVPAGGFIAFHDTCAPAQGRHTDAGENEHQREGIQVAAAISELGLPNECWELWRETPGTELSHGCRIYRRTTRPLN